MTRRKCGGGAKVSFRGLVVAVEIDWKFGTASGSARWDCGCVFYTDTAGFGALDGTAYYLGRDRVDQHASV